MLVANLTGPAVAVAGPIEAPSSERRDAAIVTRDVVVYGATPGGIVAAVAASRMGASVALVEPYDHIGGMMTNGLSWTDRGDVAVIGGIAMEFFNRVAAIEGVAWRFAFPPSTAARVFGDMLAGTNVSVHLEERLVEGPGAVAMDGERITSIQMESGNSFTGSTFIDATYEGDLMARAGVDYRIGREAIAEYGESFAGVRPQRRVMYVPAGMDPGFPLSAPGPVGSADTRIQNSNFRVCLSADPVNSPIPFPEPADYDPDRYDIVAAYIAQRTAAGLTPSLEWVLHVDGLADRKFDLNEGGSLSFGIPGLNYAYPEASYAEREQIVEAHRTSQQGFLYFIATDPRVPESMRNAINQYHLCPDEFLDNGNWPRQLYIREARRMTGAYVVSQHDVGQLRSKNDIIGIASYNLDAHAVSRWINEAGDLVIEGGLPFTGTSRWAIPYRSLTPKPGEATNLLVPVAASATHVAYASLRMEPQFMIMGQAAGTAAAMAASAGTSVQAVPYAALRSALIGAGAVLTDPGDIGESAFYNDILWAYGLGIIEPCGPGLFCPTGVVTRAMMADFIAHALALPPATKDHFTDDNGHPSEDNINRLADAGITRGCTATTYCPEGSVTRAQMASFLTRAYDLPPATRDYFTDDETSVHEADINRMAELGITRGCTATTYCPDRTIVRGEMMAFLRRASEVAP